VDVKDRENSAHRKKRTSKTPAIPFVTEFDFIS